MKAFIISVLLAVMALPVFAVGVHKDDVRYQPLINRLSPTFETVTRGLTLGNNEFDALSNIAAGKTTTELCQQLFADELQTDATYCNSGQPGNTKTVDLQDAGACLNRLYNQATGVTVSPADKNCLDSMANFLEVR